MTDTRGDSLIALLRWVAAECADFWCWLTFGEGVDE